MTTPTPPAPESTAVVITPVPDALQVTVPDAIPVTVPDAIPVTVPKAIPVEISGTPDLLAIAQTFGTVLAAGAAVVAVGVAVYYSRRTLNLSTEQHRVDRKDAFNEKVRDAVVAVGTEVMSWGSTVEEQTALLNFLASIKDGTVTSTVAPDEVELKIRTTDMDATRPAQARLNTALMSLRLLTKNEVVAPRAQAMLETLDEVRPTINAFTYADPSSLRGNADKLQSFITTIYDNLTVLLKDARKEFPFILDGEKPGADESRPPIKKRVTQRMRSSQHRAVAAPNSGHLESSPLTQQPADRETRPVQQRKR
ncbi:hypothetical protein GS545_13140 [Rhodococcus hoagii]|nr:hypothetical protein [Prescottella equi]